MIWRKMHSALCRGEGAVEGVVSATELLGNELAADVVLSGEVGDGHTSQGGQSEVAALGRRIEAAH